MNTHRPVRFPIVAIAFACIVILSLILLAGALIQAGDSNPLIGQECTVYTENIFGNSKTTSTKTGTLIYMSEHWVTIAFHPNPDGSRTTVTMPQSVIVRIESTLDP